MCLSVLGHAAARAAHGADPTPTPATESPQQWACTWARSASASSSRRWSARARARAMSSGTGGRAGGTGRRADGRADGPRDGRSHATHIDCGTLQDIAMLARAGVRHGTRACSAGEGCQVRGRLPPRSASVGTWCRRALDEARVTPTLSDRASADAHMCDTRAAAGRTRRRSRRRSAPRARRSAGRKASARSRGTSVRSAAHTTRGAAARAARRRLP